MKRKVITTKEGSHTVWCEDTGEAFHSLHGAIQETNHVFIRNGLWHLLESGEAPRILELGFGTGLNALMTYKYLSEMGKPGAYTTVEAFPLPLSMVASLNYFEHLDLRLREPFLQMHQTQPGVALQLDRFTFTRIVDDIRNPREGTYNLIYFDAFSADRQPELWTVEVFTNLFRQTVPGGLLVTYAAKSAVRRALEAAGWRTEKLPGAPGKREMLRARRPYAFAHLT